MFRVFRPHRYGLLAATPVLRQGWGGGGDSGGGGGGWGGGGGGGGGGDGGGWGGGGGGGGSGGWGGGGGGRGGGRGRGRGDRGGGRGRGGDRGGRGGKKKDPKVYKADPLTVTAAPIEIDGLRKLVGQRVLIKGVSEYTTDASLKEHLRTAGECTQVRVTPGADRQGSATAEFVLPEEAAKAIQLLHGSELEGGTLFIREDRDDPCLVDTKRRIREAKEQKLAQSTQVQGGYAQGFAAPAATPAAGASAGWDAGAQGGQQAHQQSTGGWGDNTHAQQGGDANAGAGAGGGWGDNSQATAGATGGGWGDSSAPTGDGNATPASGDANAGGGGWGDNAQNQQGGGGGW